MTSSQREKSSRRQAIRAANERFLESPCTLSREEVRIIVEDSLGQLGRRFAIHKDLTPAQSEAIEADPPTNPRAFAQLLMGLVGADTSGNWFGTMLRIAVRHFEGAAARR